VDGNGDDTALWDIWAYELASTPTEGAKGNVNGDGAVDGQKELRYVAGLPASQMEPCPMSAVRSPPYSAM